MKKFLSIAMLLTALSFAVSSCSDDNSLPNVDFSITVSGGVVDQTTGNIYVVQGDTLNIESLNVKNIDSNKNAGITGAEYYWDYQFLGSSPWPPYGFSINITPETRVGDHELTIRSTVVAEGKEPAIGIVGYNVVVVQDSTDIPVAATTQVASSMPGYKTN